MTKAADGQGSILRCTDAGCTGWIGFIRLGVDPRTGHALRRKRHGKTKKEVAEKLRKLRDEADGGLVAVTSTTTLSQYLWQWLNGRKRNLSYNTWDSYRTNVVYVDRSGIGSVRLSSLTVEHIERLYAWIVDGGRKVSTADNARRTLRAALNRAVARGYIPANPVLLAELPRAKAGEDVDIDPYMQDDIAKLIAAARCRRNGVRWQIALLGLRRSEVLGLRWEDLDLDAGAMHVRNQILWRAWQHGCPQDATGDPTCRSKGTHKKPAGLPQKGGFCPQRHSGGWSLEVTKSKAGKRKLSIPEPLLAELRDHRRRQLAERMAAGELWTDNGFVITTYLGGPRDWTSDGDDWHALLEAAGVRVQRGHATRHTAATQLLLLGVDSRQLLGVFGWSDMRLAQRYTRFVEQVANDVATRQAAMWQAAR